MSITSVVERCHFLMSDRFSLSFAPATGDGRTWKLLRSITADFVDTSPRPVLYSPALTPSHSGWHLSAPEQLFTWGVWHLTEQIWRPDEVSGIKAWWSDDLISILTTSTSHYTITWSEDFASNKSYGFRFIIFIFYRQSLSHTGKNMFIYPTGFFLIEVL